MHRRKQGSKGASHGRHHRHFSGRGHHPGDGCLRRTLRAHLMLDLAIGGAVSGLLLVYLIWALVRPEDF
jgi:K+-transporting ATPase KdpF subunit